MRTKHLIAFLVLLAMLLPAFPAQAGGIVTICDEAHLKSALAGGGTVNFSCSGTITLTSTIIIGADTTIDGFGETVTISGNNSVRVFTINPGITLNLNWLTIANGIASGPYGGGVFNNGGTLIVSYSTFQRNRAARRGGAIYNYSGQVTISSSTFVDNSGDYDSGAIYNGGTLVVSNSTFYDNVAGNEGGAIYNDGTATITNSTFSANFAWYGGAILSNTTNTTLQNTIVANNGSGGECEGYGITNGGGNISYPEAGCTGLVADPLLGPLQDNGGPTLTMAPGAGSPAIDAAVDAICAALPVNNLDQRGYTRLSGAHCDIGAVELQPLTGAQPISIDIKPGSDPNAINCRNANGIITVAILSTETFDAARVDHRTVTFEGAGEIHVDRQTGLPIRHVEDINGDGDLDLVFHFRLGDTQLSCTSTHGALLGETFFHHPFKGTDFVRMVGGR
jgi:hypothetical protein